MPKMMKNNKSMAWGIIGIGEHVRQRVAPGIKRAATATLQAVCSRTMERASNFASEHEVDLAYDSYAKMLDNPQIDAIYVSSPNNLHAEHTIQAAEAGKHVLCEKPMAITEVDCERMIYTCKKNNVKLGIAFQMRYHPAHKEVRRLIENGDIGEVALVKAQYCNDMLRNVLQRGWRGDPKLAGAGALVATGVHPIDLLRFLLNSEITEVRALCGPKVPSKLVEEMVYVILKFKNGAYGTVISGALASRSDNDAVLYGSKAKIVCSGTISMPLQGELLVEGDSLNARIVYRDDHPMSAIYVRMIEAFNKAILEDKEPDIPGYEGLQMCRITNAILSSSEQGKAVRL